MSSSLVVTPTSTATATATSATLLPFKFEFGNARLHRACPSLRILCHLNRLIFSGFDYRKMIVTFCSEVFKLLGASGVKVLVFLYSFRPLNHQFEALFLFSTKYFISGYVSNKLLDRKKEGTPPTLAHTHTHTHTHTQIIIDTHAHTQIHIHTRSHTHAHAYTSAHQNFSWTGGSSFVTTVWPYWADSFHLGFSFLAQVRSLTY